MRRSVVTRTRKLRRTVAAPLPIARRTRRLWSAPLFAAPVTFTLVFGVVFWFQSLWLSMGSTTMAMELALDVAGPLTGGDLRYAVLWLTAGLWLVCGVGVLASPDLSSRGIRYAVICFALAIATVAVSPTLVPFRDAEGALRLAEAKARILGNDFILEACVRAQVPGAADRCLELLDDPDPAIRLSASSILYARDPRDPRAREGVREAVEGLLDEIRQRRAVWGSNLCSPERNLLIQDAMVMRLRREENWPDWARQMTAARDREAWTGLLPGWWEQNRERFSAD